MILLGLDDMIDWAAKRSAVQYKDGPTGRKYSMRIVLPPHLSMQFVFIIIFHAIWCARSFSQIFAHLGFTLAAFIIYCAFGEENVVSWQKDSTIQYAEKILILLFKALVFLRPWTKHFLCIFVPSCVLQWINILSHNSSHATIWRFNIWKAKARFAVFFKMFVFP